MSTERRLVKNTAWLVLQPLLLNVLSLAATGYIARQLGSSEFGRFNLAYAFVAMFAPLTSLGLRPLAVRHIAQHRDTAGEYLGRVLVLRCLLALLAAVIVIAAAPLSGGSGEARAVVTIAALGMIFTALGSVFTDGFQAFESMRPASIAAFAGGLLLTIISVVVIGVGGGIREMALAYALGPVCTFLLLWAWARRQSFRPRLSWNLPAFGEMLRHASPFFLITLLDVVSTRVDLMILARVLGEANLGDYAAAMSLVTRAMVLSDGASSALLPTIAYLTASTPAAAVPLVRKAVVWLLAASLPLSLLTTALSPQIVSVIFGSQYVAAAPILALAIWRLPLTCLAMLGTQSLLAVGQQTFVLRTFAISLVINLALMVPLIHFMGPIGAAVALTIRPMITFVLRLPAMRRYFPGVWPWRQLACLVAALAAMSAPLILAPGLAPGIKLLAVILVSAALYTLSLVWLRVVPLSLLQRVWQRVMGRLARGRQSGGRGPVAETKTDVRSTPDVAGIRTSEI